MSGEGLSRENRGVSTTFSIVILVAMAVTGAALVVSLGGQTLDTVESQSQTNMAEESFREADSRIGKLVKSSETRSTKLSISRDMSGQFNVNESAGTLDIEVTNKSMAAASPSDICSLSRPIRLGTIKYEDENSKIAYQGGGVWRKSGSDYRMVSPPGIEYRNDRLKLSLANITSDEPIRSSSLLVSNEMEQTRQIQSRVNEALRDCVTNWTASGDVVPATVNTTITIESEFAGAWAQYANESLPTAKTRYDADANTVKLTFKNVGDNRYDADNDGLPVGVDPDPSDADPDGDGVDDGEDDCPTTYATISDGCPAGGGGGDGGAGNSTDGGDGGAGDGGAGDGGDGGDDDRGHGSECDNDDEDDPGSSDGPQNRTNNPYCPGDASNGSSSGQALRLAGEELVVEGTRADIKLLGAEAGTLNETEYEVTGEEYRDPMDVAFVLDESGSMIRDDDRTTLAKRLTSGWYTWIGTWDTPQNADGTYTVPSDEVWYVGGIEHVPGEDVRIRPGTWVQVYEVGNDPDGERITATRSFVGELNGSFDRASAVQFSSVGYYPGGAEVVQPLTSDFDELNASLSTEAEGNTNISAGIYRGLETLNEGDSSDERERVMVLLSDGQHNRGQPYPEEAAEAAASENTTIYTVGLGDEADEQTLRKVANETDGNYYHATNAGELESVFEQIARESQTRTVRRIDHQAVTTKVSVGQQTLHLGDDGSLMASGSDARPLLNLNANGQAPETRNYTVQGVSAESRMTFTGRTFRCGSYRDTNRTAEADNKTYTHMRCDRFGQRLETVSTGSSTYDVYEDGDTLPSGNASWWQHDQRQIVGSQYLDGNTVDVGTDEMLVVIHFDDDTVKHGHVALLVRGSGVPDGGDDGDGGDGGDGGAGDGGDGGGSGGDPGSGSSLSDIIVTSDMPVTVDIAKLQVNEK